jgi:hypothetical protein
MINFLKNNVITHEGQSTVKEFGEEIIAKKQAIAKIPNLKVYTGYHGDDQGDWSRDFDQVEKGVVESIKEKHFPNATLVWCKEEKGFSDEQIRVALAEGSVFFTWCDSHAKVTSLQ